MISKVVNKKFMNSSCIYVNSAGQIKTFFQFIGKDISIGIQYRSLEEDFSCLNDFKLKIITKKQNHCNFSYEENFLI